MFDGIFCMCYSMLKALFALISVLQIPLGNIHILRNQNTFTLGLHLMQYLTLKAIAVPVQLQISQFGSERTGYVIGAVCI